MKAWQVLKFGPPEEVLTALSTDFPVPSAGEVVIDVATIGIGVPDLLMVRGEYQFVADLPFIPGTEMAGTVSAVAPDSPLVIGDRVVYFGTGGLAEQVVAPAVACLPIPDELSFEDATCLLVNYGTALLGLEDRARLQPGETVLVTGAAGGVGSAAIEVSKALGATAIGVVGGAEKASAVARIGADIVIDHTEVDVTAAVLEVTDGQGADVVFEVVGGVLFDSVRRALGWHGRLVVAGFASGAIPQISANKVLLRSAEVLGVNALGELLRRPSLLVEVWERIATMLELGQIHPLVHEVYPFERAVDAFADLAERRAIGKVLVSARR